MQQDYFSRLARSFSKDSLATKNKRQINFLFKKLQMKTLPGLLNGTCILSKLFLPRALQLKVGS